MRGGFINEDFKLMNEVKNIIKNSIFKEKD